MDHRRDLKYGLPAIQRSGVSTDRSDEVGVLDKGTAANLHDDVLIQGRSADFGNVGRYAFLVGDQAD
jgi:hypothetical protein